MPGLRAMLFNFYLKRAMKSKPIHLIDPDLLRTNTDKIAPRKTPKAVTLDVLADGPVKGEWHKPVARPVARLVNGSGKEAGRARTVLYLHGGGYVFGSAKSHRGLTFRLAEEARADLFSLDYRLAPEHPYPAAVEDAVAAYRMLLEEGRDPARLVIGGDSAGGGLALALLLSCKDEGLPLPAGAFLYSPWTDLAATGPSLDTNEASDVMFKKEYIAQGAKRYTAGADPTQPLISPLYGDLAGLPPTLIFVSDAEALMSDSTRLHEKLKSAGVESEMIVEHGLAHVWPIFYPLYPEAARSIRRTADFVAACAGRAS